MTKIEAIIRLEKAGDVKQALDDMGICRMTLTHVHAIGLEKAKRSFLSRLFPARNTIPDAISKLKIELTVSDKQADAVVNAIARSGRTGRLGDGQIVLSRIEQAVRIRTLEMNDNAL